MRRKTKKNKEFRHGLFIGIYFTITLIGLIYLGYLYSLKNPLVSKLIAIPEEIFDDE